MIMITNSGIYANMVCSVGFDNEHLVLVRHFMGWSNSGGFVKSMLWNCWILVIFSFSRALDFRIEKENLYIISELCLANGRELTIIVICCLMYCASTPEKIHWLLLTLYTPPCWTMNSSLFLPLVDWAVTWLISFRESLRSDDILDETWVTIFGWVLCHDCSCQVKVRSLVL